jgi:hypothetical protein
LLLTFSVKCLQIGGAYAYVVVFDCGIRSLVVQLKSQNIHFLDRHWHICRESNIEQERITILKFCYQFEWRRAMTHTYTAVTGSGEIGSASVKKLNLKIVGDDSCTDIIYHYRSEVFQTVIYSLL